MTGRWSVVATASLNGAQVDDVRVDAPGVLEVGRDGQLRLPAPAGAPFVCRATWEPDGRLVVVDGLGRTHRIGPDQQLEIALGALSVELGVVRRFPLRRTAPVAWSGSLAWFLTVFAVSLTVAQAEKVWGYRCPWFGIDCPTAAEGFGVNHEYLARLLEEDHEGEEQGYLVRETRPTGVDGEPITLRRPVTPTAPDADVYLPAGAPTGPRETFGGAERTAPEPQRRPDEARGKPAPPSEAPALEASQDVGTPVVAPAELPAPPDDLDVADDGLDTDAAEADVTRGQELAEEDLGFGLKDWMDLSPEEREVELTIRVAKHRLRIDPDDPGALSTLAYYQYLGSDLEAAERTYDRLIELFPEDAAAYNNKALIYKRRSQYDKEEGLYRVALAIEPTDTTAMNNLAVNLAHQGRFDEALSYMEQLEALLPDDPYSDLHRAKIHAERGDDASALSFLERALVRMAELDTLHHIEFRQDIRVDPSFAKLRNDPRFRAILKRFYGDDSPVEIDP